MTPAEAGFDGAKGIRMNCPWMKDGGRFQLRRGKRWPTPKPLKDCLEQLLWLYPDDQPPQLFWCNADGQWFEVSFNPIENPCLTSQCLHSTNNSATN
jgi:hypothetical protein